MRVSLPNIGLGVLVAVLLVAVVVTLSPPIVTEWLQRWDQLLLGASSVVLTAFLVILYSDQRDVLSANHRAVVEVDEVQPNGNDMILSMSNFGHGVATDTQLIIASVFPETELYEPDVVARDLSRSDEKGNASRYGQSLKAGANRRRFKGRVGIPLNSGQPDVSVQGFRSGVRYLHEDGLEVMRLHFYVRYRDLLDEWHIRHFYSLEFDADIEYESFEAAAEEGGVMIHGEPDISADELSMDLSDAVTAEERTVI